jgi:hypothetical protein
MITFASKASQDYQENMLKKRLSREIELKSVHQYVTTQLHQNDLLQGNAKKICAS